MAEATLDTGVLGATADELVAFVTGGICGRMDSGALPYKAPAYGVVPAGAE